MTQPAGPSAETRLQAALLRLQAGLPSTPTAGSP